MKQPINEIRRMQQLAGVVNESEYQEEVMKDEEKVKEIKTGNLAGSFGYGSVEGPQDPQLRGIAKILVKLNNEISSTKTDSIIAALENVKTPTTPEGQKLKQDIQMIIKLQRQLYLAINSAISSTVDIDSNM